MRKNDYFISPSKISKLMRRRRESVYKVSAAAVYAVDAVDRMLEDMTI